MTIIINITRQCLRYFNITFKFICKLNSDTREYYYIIFLLFPRIYIFIANKLRAAQM